MGKDTKKFSIYLHENKINKKKYFGITSQKPIKRWNCGNAYKHNKYFFSSILKYGWNGFSHEILESNLSKEVAEQKEKEFIAFYHTTNREFGYNIAEGGLVNIPSKETKNKISLKQKGRKVSNSTKEKLRKSHEGKKRNVEELRKLERKVLIKNINTGKELSFNSIIEASNFLKCSRFSVSAVCRKKYNSIFGWSCKYFEDTRNLLNKKIITNSRAIYSINPKNNEKIFYSSIAEAKRKLKTNAHISECANGKQKTAFKLKWKYKED